jgi:hypothetical protein
MVTNDRDALIHVDATLDRAASLDPHTLERTAAIILADALALAAALHLPGGRDRHRRQLEHAIDLANRVLAAAGENGGDVGRDARLSAGARSTLVQAHAARARDARHGAGQLSLGAQRAPTCEACDDGWRRVEEIVTVAEASALVAARMAAELDNNSAWKAARAAEAAARDARRIVDERNHAYTFHADPGFSFGEGWYLAAAAVLAGVAIQIEPAKPQTPQVERFLRDAGLIACSRSQDRAGRSAAGPDARSGEAPNTGCIQASGDAADSPAPPARRRGGLLEHALGTDMPYRSRPRANKHLPEIVARAFRADPLSAQRKLRAAFLGDAPIPQAVIDWADGRLAGVSAGRKVLLWVRYSAHHPMRNTTYPELVELARRALAASLLPVLVGDAIRDGELSWEPATGSQPLPRKIPSGAVDMTLFWKEPIFQGADMRRAQLQLFEHLKGAHRLVGQLGVTTAGMDGPALMGLPTMYLTDAPNPRMRTWVGTVPGYREVVRSDGYLERVSDRLRRWADDGEHRRPDSADGGDDPDVEHSESAVCDSSCA